MPKIIKIKEIAPKIKELKNQGNGKKNNLKHEGNSNLEDLSAQSQIAPTPSFSPSLMPSQTRKSRAEPPQPSTNLEQAVPAENPSRTNPQREQQNPVTERMMYQGQARDIYTTPGERRGTVYEAPARRRTSLPESRVAPREISSPVLGSRNTSLRQQGRNDALMPPAGQQGDSQSPRDTYEEQDPLERKRKDKWQF